ncbi:hypothetical protein CAPN004_07300 [Capnocytophaga cynodegmi]|nr:hypothetical protein CAPN004_07300 [Capnocytophaga cynodegmi]
MYNSGYFIPYFFDEAKTNVINAIFTMVKSTAKEVVTALTDKSENNVAEKKSPPAAIYSKLYFQVNSNPIIAIT